MKTRAASCTDGYKVGHGPMYADGTTSVYSNLTPRSDKIYARNCTRFYDGKLVWVGAQGAVQEIKELWDEFFASKKEYVISRYARRMAVYLGGEVAATQQLAALHDLGYLPLRIKSLPEGIKVNMGIPVMTITNTKDEFFWLVNYLETIMSGLTWKVATNATIAAEYKAICKHYAELTGIDDFTVSIQCHDFSMRGMSGPEDAARAGFGHLVSFIGTDTIPAMDYAEDYYDADPDSLIAITVPATEHAVATNNILFLEDNIKQIVAGVEDNVSAVRLQAEMMFMQDLITRKHPAGIVSYVADSFDFWAVLTDILPAMKETIMSRAAAGPAPGKLVIRPDSGDPVKVICGYKVIQVMGLHYAEISDAINAGAEVVKFGDKYYSAEPVEWDQYDTFATKYDLTEVPEVEVKGAIEILWEIFGGTETATGYKLLDSHIGLIYGDSITTKRAEDILRRLADKGFASGNVVFGVGSYTYQCNTRDTFGFAVKATNTVVNGASIAIFKDPKTDSKKKSAKGLLRVDCASNGECVLTDNVTRGLEKGGMLTTIFENGEFVKRVTLEEIRGRLSK